MAMKTVRQKPFGSVMSTIFVVAFIIITTYSGYAASFCTSYKFIRSKTSWTEARQECQRQSGYLVAMENEEEWEFLKFKVQDVTFQSHNGDRWYIGLWNVSDKWCWITSNDSCIEGKVGSSRWSMGEPNNFDSEGCVEMMNKGLYNNVKCYQKTETTGYICERQTDCSTSDNTNLIVRRQNSTVPKVPNSEGDPTATTKPTTKMMTTNPKTELATTAKSKDAGATTRTLAATNLKVTKKLSNTISSTISHVSSPLQSEKHETDEFNTKGTKDTASPVLKYFIESNQKKKSQWVTTVIIGVPAVILVVLLILLGYIIKRRMVSKKSEAGYSSKTKDKNTSWTEDNSPGSSSWSKEHVYGNVFPENRKHKTAPLAPSGESSKMLSEQGNKTDEQKYLYATVDKTRKKKTNAGVHFKPFSADLVYAELDFNPSSQDASGATAKEAPSKVPATVYASIEEICG